MFGTLGRKGKRPKGHAAENDSGGATSEEKIQNAVESWLGSPAEDDKGRQTKKANRLSTKVKAGGGGPSESEPKKSKGPKKNKGRKDQENPKKSPEETQLFGIPITLAAKRSDPEHGLIPLPLRNAVRFLNEKSLEEEGLYRVPGSHAKYLEYKALFDAGEDVDFCEVEKIHQNVAMMVMKFLKDLPEPLYTNTLEGHVKKTLYGVKDKAKQERNLRKVMGYLPLVNREVFRFLVAHLRVLAEHRTAEQTNASIMSWGISLGRTMGRLMEVLFEGSDDLIPHTIAYGEEFEVAAQRSHKKGLLPSPIRFGVNALLTAQQESYENLIDKCLVEIPEETVRWMDMRYVLDGGCKSNPLLDQDPTDTFNLMCFFMHEIPGSIFTPDLPATLESFLPSSEAEVDPSVVEKVKTEVDQLPAPNYESLKLLAWFFNQLHNVEDAPVDKIRQMEVRLIGGPSTVSNVFSFLVTHYSELWPEIVEEVEEAKEEVVEEANEGSGDEDPDPPDVVPPPEEEDSKKDYPSTLAFASFSAPLPPPLPPLPPAGSAGGHQKGKESEGGEECGGENEEGQLQRNQQGGDKQTGSGLTTPLLPPPLPASMGLKAPNFLPKGEGMGADGSVHGNGGEAFENQYTFE